MTFNVSGLNLFAYGRVQELPAQVSSSLTSGASKAWEWIKESAAAKAVAWVGERSVVRLANLIVHAIRPVLDNKLAEQLPVFAKSDRDNLLNKVLAPISLTKEERQELSYKNRLVTTITDFVKARVINGSIAYLIDDAIDRVLSKGRMQSMAFNILTRVNLYAPSILKGDGEYGVSKYELDIALTRAKNELLESDYFYEGTTKLSRALIRPTIHQAFSKEAFEGYVEQFKNVFEDQLLAFNESADSDLGFLSEKIKQDFFERMTLEVLKAVVEELSSPEKQVNDPRVARGLNQSVRQFFLNIQPLIPHKNAHLREWLDELQAEEQVATFPQRDLVAEEAEAVEEYVEESQYFFEDHPWIARGLQFFGYDTSREAMQRRVENLRTAALPEEVPDEFPEEESLVEEHNIAADLVDEAIHSPVMVDKLFEIGLDVSTIVERYRQILLENYHAEESRGYELEISDDGEKLFAVSIKNRSIYSPDDDFMVVKSSKERVEIDDAMRDIFHQQVLRGHLAETA